MTGLLRASSIVQFRSPNLGNACPAGVKCGKTPPGPSRGGTSGPPGPALLFGKMAPATLEISIFSGNLLRIPPGAAFGGAPGALRAPGKGYFQMISAEN